MTSTPPDQPGQPEQPFGAGQPAYPGPQEPAAYGAYPAGPGGPGQRPAPPAQPSSIATAVKLMYAGAVLSALTLVYSLTTLGGLKDEIRTQLEKNDVNVTQATVDAAYGVTIVFAVLFGLVGALLWLWMAWKNGQGRKWARVVATVLAAFNLVGVLITLAGAANAEPLSLVSSVISCILAVAILVLLYKKESTAYYDGVAASQKMY